MNLQQPSHVVRFVFLSAFSFYLSAYFAKARAAVQDWNGALEDAVLSVQVLATPRGQAQFHKISLFVESRRRDAEPTGSVLQKDTGLAPGSSSLRSVRVTSGCSVTLREVYLCTTGGRLWHAGLLLANHLLSERSGCKIVQQLVTQAGEGKKSRVLELGAGLGLVGLALGHALANAGVGGSCCVTLTDCDPETNDNLRQEVALNSHRLVDLMSLELEPKQVGATASCAMAVGELDYGPSDALSSARLLAPTDRFKFDLVVGSDTVFSETHASLGIALGNLIAKPDGQAVLCLADKRTGLGAFLKTCAKEGLSVDVVPIDEGMLAVAQDETDDEDLGEARSHSLYFVRPVSVCS
jgi:predicted nicotinamide N-methyase